jgi:hypothetical protein
MKIRGVGTLMVPLLLVLITAAHCDRYHTSEQEVVKNLAELLSKQSSSSTTVQNMLTKLGKLPGFMGVAISIFNVLTPTTDAR